jgi:hypothetical protein
VVAPPAAHLDDGQLAADGLVAQGRDLAGGHAVAVGDRDPADERAVAGEDGAALDVDAADGVRAIEDDDLDAGLGARLHHVEERPDVGVVARADVLDVVDHGVDAGEHLGARVQRRLAGAVERVHRQPGHRVARLADADHVLGVAADAVLGAKQADELDAVARVEEVDDVAELDVDGRRVDEERDALAAKRRRLA